MIHEINSICTNVIHHQAVAGLAAEGVEAGIADNRSIRIDFRSPLEQYVSRKKRSVAAVMFIHELAVSALVQSNNLAESGR
jgi:hypothetical protein